MAIQPLVLYRLHASLANDRNTSFHFNFIENVEFAHNMGIAVGLPLLSQYSSSTSFQLVVCLAWLSFLFISFCFLSEGGGGMGSGVLVIHPFFVEPSEQTFVSRSLHLKHEQFGVKSIEIKGLGNLQSDQYW